MNRSGWLTSRETQSTRRTSSLRRRMVGMTCLAAVSGFILAALYGFSLTEHRAFAQEAQATSDADSNTTTPKPANDTKTYQSTANQAEEQAPKSTKPPVNPEFDEDASALPTLESLELPSPARLLEGPAYDWLVLSRDEKVILIEPVYPRPGALEAVEAAIARAAARPFPPRRTPDEMAAYEKEVARRRALQYLKIQLPEGDIRDYRIHHRSVAKIVYYEDQMLLQIDRLLDRGEIPVAVDLLTALEQRHPNWPGAEERHQRLLLVDAKKQREHGADEVAFALLKELHGRNPQFAGLSAELATVADKLIGPAFEQHDYRRARYYLGRLQELESNNPAARRWRQRLDEEATSRQNAATAREKEGNLSAALDELEKACRIAPERLEVTDQYRRIAGRHHRLHVGVVSASEWPSTPQANDPFAPAAARHQEFLLQTPLFEPVRLDGKVVRYSTSFFRDWEPTELGEQIQFRLEPGLNRAGANAPLTAAQIVPALANRLRHDHPEFDERFAAYVSKVSFRSPFELTVDFQHAPLRPEALFHFPIVETTRGDSLARSTASLQNALPPAMTATTLCPRFSLMNASEDKRIYRRSLPQPSGTSQPALAEVIEHRYEEPGEAVQALIRGDVSLVPRVVGKFVPLLENHPDLFVLEYAVPATHVLQFHPENRTLQNLAFRRALAMSINRKRLAEEVFKTADSRLVRPTSAPVPKKSYAYNGLIEPHPYDRALAYSLFLAAKKELGGEIPPLRLRIPDEPLIRNAAKQMVRDWEQMGLAITLEVSNEPLVSPRDETGESSWDIVYRPVSLVEPLTELWPCLTLQSQARIESLAPLPTWLRQELIALDAAGDWKSAGRILHRIHRFLWAEAHLIPLWEVSEFLAVRKSVQGVPSRPMNPYQGCEHWRIPPTLPRGSL